MISKIIKRQLIKRFRLTNLLWSSLEKGLYCFNFHRIGDKSLTDFDPCVFSCQESDLKQYLTFLKQEFKVINLAELENIITKQLPIKEKLALITFDDGYKDNFELAYPTLSALNISATFFITTGLIDSNCIPWWDEIAWHIKHCAGRSIKLSIWLDEITIPIHPDEHIIRVVLKRCKTYPELIDQQLEELRALTKRTINTTNTPLFMSWDNLRNMLANGMDIGAHSHTHRILSSLEGSELLFELTESKRLLEAELNTEVNSVSYPVGGASSYNQSMFKLLAELGYKLGFSFQPIMNKKPYNNQYNLGRLSIDSPFDEKAIKEQIILSKYD